jgi:hypothetical protein
VEQDGTQGIAEREKDVRVIVPLIRPGINVPKINHRLYLGHIHAGNIECSDFESGCLFEEDWHLVGCCHLSGL